jgi:hypothetical protein
MPSDWAWLTLAAGVAGWDSMCPRGHTLSEGVGRYHQARPWLTRLTVAYLVAHLLDWLPQRVDILHRLTKGRRT